MADGTFRVLVSDKLAAEGLSVFKAAGERIKVDVKVGMPAEELSSVIGQYDALAIRSATQVTPEVIQKGDRLKVIGRAGIGVDNIDVPAATKKGIVVMNTPEGNIVTTAEHAIALMLSLARKVPQATASMRAGKWEKSKFQGREICGKTLGVVGLGNIGKIVAERALGLFMKVIAYDPYVTPERALELGVESVSLDDLLARSDFITLHIPVLEATKNIISKAAIEKMKKGAFLINAARGGLVDEDAAAEALKSGKLGGAAFDVFLEEPPPSTNPLLQLENVILTPHLGASTDEAQVNVSIAVAEQIVDYLLKGVVKSAVNAPNVAKEHIEKIDPYLRLARKMGSFAGQMHSGNVRKVRFIYAGSAADLPIKPISVSLLTGLLRTQLGEMVNEVSAPNAAKERGIEIVEEKTATPQDFAGTVTIRVIGDTGETVITGTLFGNGEPRIVAVNGVRLEIVPEGHLLITRHHDKPGIIGRIGTAIGEQSLNISRLVLGLTEKTGVAQAVLSVDGSVDKSVLDKLSHVDGIEEIRHFAL
jgi:D-3-phosphoglycerate dehydrogenase